MRVSIAVAILAVLLLSQQAYAQQVNPTSLSFEAIPPNTSPEEGIAFTNTGTSELTLSISISGPPFMIAENRCGKGVKPKSHCNLYLTYTPQTVGEVDSGTLSINYGEGVVAVPLSGQGVSSIPTWAHLRPAKYQCSKIHLGNPFSMYGTLGLEDKYYALPTGEQVYFSCTNGQETVNLGAVTLELCSKHCPEDPGGPGRYDDAGASFTPDQEGSWSCTMTYDGDGILGANSAEVAIEVKKPGKPERCCCGG